MPHLDLAQQAFQLLGSGSLLGKVTSALQAWRHSVLRAEEGHLEKSWGEIQWLRRTGGMSWACQKASQPGCLSEARVSWPHAQSCPVIGCHTLATLADNDVCCSGHIKSGAKGNWGYLPWGINSKGWYDRFSPIKWEANLNVFFLRPKRMELSWRTKRKKT